MSPSYANRRSAFVCFVTAIPCALSIAIREAKRWATEHVPQIRDRKDGTAMIRLPLTAVVKNRLYSPMINCRSLTTLSSIMTLSPALPSIFVMVSITIFLLGILLIDIEQVQVLLQRL